MKLPALCLALALAGCVSYKHQHVNLDGTTDLTTFNALLYMGAASKIRTAVKSTNYSRTVSVGSVEGKGDADFISAIAEGAARGAISAMKKEKEEP